MDAKETLARLPLTGSLFVLLLGLAFFLCRAQDLPLQAAIHTFHQTHLLTTEAPLFEDFYSKRLAIEEQGTEKTLREFRQALADQNDRRVIHFILADRSFRSYLQDKSHLYFTTPQAETWRQHSQELEQQLPGLSTYQFALIPEQFKQTPEFSRLLSYVFVETALPNLLTNILLLLGLFALLERQVRRSTLWTCLISLSMLHATLYLILADVLSVPLAGSNILVYFFLSLATVKYAHAAFRAGFTVHRAILSVLVISLFLKAAFDSYFGYVTRVQVPGILLACLAGGVFVWAQIRRQTASENLEDQQAAEADARASKESELSPEIRKRFQEALTALTRFNFSYSRNALAELHSLAPDSIQLLESRYHLEKLHPEDGHFWPLLEASIEHAVRTDNYNELLKLIRDSQKCASAPGQGKLAIAPSTCLKLLQIFIQNHNLEKAEYAFALLQQTDNQPLIQDACRILVEQFARQKRLAKQAHYQELYDQLT